MPAHIVKCPCHLPRYPCRYLNNLCYCYRAPSLQEQTSKYAWTKYIKDGTRGTTKEQLQTFFQLQWCTQQIAAGRACLHEAKVVYLLCNVNGKLKLTINRIIYPVPNFPGVMNTRSLEGELLLPDAYFVIRNSIAVTDLLCQFLDV